MSQVNGVPIHMENNSQGITALLLSVHRLRTVVISSYSPLSSNFSTQQTHTHTHTHIHTVHARMHASQMHTLYKSVNVLFNLKGICVFNSMQLNLFFFFFLPYKR